ncbi:hypothetical protein Tco_1508404 [Tanacetum coccineum]
MHKDDIFLDSKLVYLYPKDTRSDLPRCDGANGVCGEMEIVDWHMSLCGLYFSFDQWFTYKRIQDGERPSSRGSSLYISFPFSGKGALKASGLKVNLSKSRILGVGLDQTEVESVALSLNCSHDIIPFIYLGLPMGFNTRMDGVTLGSNWIDIINAISHIEQPQLYALENDKIVKLVRDGAVIMVYGDGNGIGGLSLVEDL